MKEPQLNPQVTAVLTAHDEEHMITYMRVLDVDQQGADWRKVSRIVLRIDPDTEAHRARRVFERPPLACQMDDRARLIAICCAAARRRNSQLQG